MKIGMNLLLWTDCPKFSEHAALIRQLKGWGFDGVEFPISAMHDHDLSSFSALCDELGLGRTAIIALDATSADPSSEDERLRQGAINELKKCIDKTCKVGSDLLVGPIFQGLGKFTGASPTEDEWLRSVETLRSVGEYAAAAGVRIALEPLNRFEMYIVNTVGQGAKFIQDVGLSNVGLLVDTHHGNIEEEDTAEAWYQVKDHIFHVHISENHRGIPGSGQAISPRVFEVLQNVGYDQWLTIEAFGQSVPGLISRLHLWRSVAPSEEHLARTGLEFIRRSVDGIKKS